MSATKKSSLICCTLVCLLLVALMLGSWSCFGYFMYPRSADGTVRAGGAAVVLVSDGVNSFFTRNVIVAGTKDQSDTYPLNLSFYTTPCEDIPVLYKILPTLTYPVLTPIFSIRSPFNYYSADRGLYAAGANSTLLYTATINWTTSTSDTDICPLKWFLFDNVTKYTRFLNTDPSFPAEGFVAESRCLPANGTENYTLSVDEVTFALNKSAFYYVAGQFEKGVSVRVNISANTRQYSTRGLVRQNCYLNSTVHSCNLPISEGIATQQTQVCVLSYSEFNLPLWMNYTTTPTGVYNIGSVVTVGGALGWLLLATAIGIVYASCIYVRYHKRRRRRIEYSPINYMYSDYGTAVTESI